MLREIVIREMSGGYWAWYLKEKDQDGASARTVKSCQAYSSGPDAAWRQAMTALEILGAW